MLWGRRTPAKIDATFRVRKRPARRLGADDGLDDLATLVHLHRGDGGDLVLRSGLRVLVDIELDDLDLVGVLGGDLVEDRADGATRTAPLSPEVHQNGLLAVEDVLLEAGVRNRTCC